MFNSIRTKLTITYIGLVLVVMVLTSVFLLNILGQYYTTYQFAAITAAGKLVSGQAAGYLRSTPDVTVLSNLADYFARQIGARVLITDTRQRVLGDSLRVGGLVGTTLDRDEIAAVLDGETGRSVQYSEQSQQWVMQVAVPVLSEGRGGDDGQGEIIGAVFISASMSPLYVIINDIRRYLMIVTAFSLLLAGLLGLYLAHRITVPIETLTAATDQIARGDLTQRVPVQSRDEIGRLAAQFNHMTGRLQEMTRQLREFVSNASHEMRTPLTSLNILVKSLREYPLEEEEREEFLADIDQELERLIHLVESLLDLTRLDRLGAEDTLSMADVVPAVAGTLEMLQKRAYDKGISLEYNLPDHSTPVLAVIHQIKQVVFNLVDNAIKYTPAGGRILVRVTDEPDQLVLAVSDTGIGIPPSHREKIFERFYRVDKARSREMGGTGLGLSIVWEIVHRHGGRIWVEDNEDGAGTTFMVTLPRAGELNQGIIINKN
jgi:signal transduction histidine kinase